MSALPRHLLAPGRIGKMETKNRIVVTAMGVSFADPDNTAGDRLVAYHERQAAGGAGLIIVGVTGVAHPVGAVIGDQTSLSDDRFIPGMRRRQRAGSGTSPRLGKACDTNKGWADTATSVAASTLRYFDDNEAKRAGTSGTKRPSAPGSGSRYVTFLT